jgi:hypothetical protein
VDAEQVPPSSAVRASQGGQHKELTVSGPGVATADGRDRLSYMEDNARTTTTRVGTPRSPDEWRTPHWKRSLRHSLRETPTFYIGKTLAGVAWPCPACHHSDSVELRLRRLRRFGFKCARRRCGWSAEFSFLRAFEMLEALGVPHASNPVLPPPNVD